MKSLFGISNMFNAKWFFLTILFLFDFSYAMYNPDFIRIIANSLVSGFGGFFLCLLASFFVFIKNKKGVFLFLIIAILFLIMLILFGVRN